MITNYLYLRHDEAWTGLSLLRQWFSRCVHILGLAVLLLHVMSQIYSSLGAVVTNKTVKLVKPNVNLIHMPGKVCFSCGLVRALSAVIN